MADAFQAARLRAIADSIEERGEPASDPENWSPLVDLAYDDEDMEDRQAPMMATPPQYPYGLRICLTDRELDKLGQPMPAVGDVIDMRAFACVTSVSDDGTCKRVEMQIEMLSVENEEEEDEHD